MLLSIARPILGVLCICMLACVVYDRVPRTQAKSVNYKRCKMVPEQREFHTHVEIDGKWVAVSVPYTTSLPVYETAVRTYQIVPTVRDWLGFAVLGVIVLVCGLYAIVLLYLWVQDKRTQRRDSADRRDTEKRLDAIITLFVGVFLGLSSVGGSSGGEESSPTPISEPAPVLTLPDPAPTLLPPPSDNAPGSDGGTRANTT